MDLKESASGGQRHPWEIARLQVVDEMLQRHLEPTNGWIVDVGCGDLYVCRELARRHPHLRFLAVDSAFDEERLEESSIVAFRDLHAAADFLGPDEPILTVLLMDVLEHIEHDGEFLRELREARLIRTETRVLITVPAFQSLFCSHDRFLGHFRRYHRRGLEQFLRDQRFEVLESGYFFFLLLLARLVAVVRERLLPRVEDTSQLLEWKRGPLLTRLVAQLLYSDYRVGRWLPVPGLSTYALAQNFER